MIDQHLAEFIQTSYRFTTEITDKFLTIDELYDACRNHMGRSITLNELVSTVFTTTRIQRKKHTVDGKEKRVWFLEEN